MRFLEYIKVNNYLNLKYARLGTLRDLNIIIGPNNCGKTSLLRAINLLSRIDFARFSPSYRCDLCVKVFNKDANVHSAQGNIEFREKYLTKGMVRVVFGYNKDEVHKILPQLVQRQISILNASESDATLKDHLGKEFEKARLEMKTSSTSHQLVGEHISPIVWSEVKTRISDHILLCPDERLQQYKGESIPEHIKKMNLTTSAQKQIIELLKTVVDPKMLDFRYSLDFDREIEDQPFTTSIAEQGSGVKSLVCLIADILSDRQAKILLIDEPELGLNPSSKHAFLKFLIRQSRNKQIFLATHDPTFVNPILWNRKGVSVYLYSIANDDFVKVNLVQSKEDPSTFAGFLPHTTSLKRVHIYVEGTYDVYVFQMFLEKYVRGRFKEGWYRILNEIGIFHLGGDFWSHLLYTIPKSPYTTIVVLDGDKREGAEQVVSKYATIEIDRFRIFDSLDKLVHEKESRKPIMPMPCPIYCLKKTEIEDYLETKYGDKLLLKEDGPSVAQKMNSVPPEIVQLFDAIFRIANIRNE